MESKVAGDGAGKELSQGSSKMDTFNKRNADRKRPRQRSIQMQMKSHPMKRRKVKEDAEGKKSRFLFFRDEKDAKAAGYLYRRVWVADIPMLMEGKGLKMIQSLGLEEFLKEPVPPLSKRLCDEFLSTFDSATNCGHVAGRLVKLDVESVMLATKLPTGFEKVPLCCDNAGLRKLMPGSYGELKTSRGFNMEKMFDRKDMDCFQAVAGMLMVKLEARKECFQFVSGEVLIALDKSLEESVQVDWAEYLTRLMLRTSSVTSKRVPSSSIGYQYGEWLTRIITNEINKEERLMIAGASGNNERGVLEHRGELQPFRGFATDNWIVPIDESDDLKTMQEENERLRRKVEAAELEMAELKLKAAEGSDIVRDTLAWLKLNRKAVLR